MLGGAAAGYAAPHFGHKGLFHFGHKGLFLDRLDSPAADAYGGEVPRLVPSAHAVYQVRNRAYSPGLGRFFQMDPNASATVLLEGGYHGRGMGAVVAAFDLQGLYGDGGSLYGYLGSNPWIRSDPTGLSWDPFDAVDEYLAEDAGSKAAFLDRIVGTAHTTAYVATYLASWLPFPAVAIAAGAANAAIGRPDSLAQSELWMGVERVGAAVNLLALGKLMGTLTLAATKAATGYASHFGSFGPAKAAMAASGITGRIVALGAHAQHLGKILPYRQARLLTAGQKGAIQAHHLIEVRHITRNGLSNLINTNSIPCVILTEAEHLAVTNELRRRLPYGVTHDMDTVWREYQEAYRGYPAEWLDAIRGYFR